jgi:hypothetical protein
MRKTGQPEEPQQPQPQRQSGQTNHLYQPQSKKVVKDGEVMGAGRLREIDRIMIERGCRQQDQISAEQQPGTATRQAVFMVL